MENKIVNNNINNLNNGRNVQQNNANERRYFSLPSVGSTMQSFDTSSDKLIKPLDGKGYLVNNDLVHMPKEFLRDTVYTTKALADGVRGKANDHQLGKMNDLGIKLSGIAIATYLMTKKSTPKTKAMEFIGFGAFLASMALWPKLALEIPARLIHGFNFRKQYIDDQGRKKFVSQDPNYIPFDLYKGDKKSEDLDVIGDRLGIKRDIPNRHEAVKEQMRKISVQNNTLWMLTAGFATPIMTALACNRLEPYVGQYAEKLSNRKVNSEVQTLDDYLKERMPSAGEAEKYERNVLGLNKVDKKGNPVLDKTEEMIRGLKGHVVSEDKIDLLADTMAAELDPEMKEAAKEDIVRMTGGSKYIVNQNAAQRLSGNIHSAVLAKDANLAAKLNPQRLEQITSNAMVQGAVRELLGEVADDVIRPAGDSANDTLASNFSRRDVAGIDFFKVTPETENMTPAERLAHNIKSVILKVNNSNPSEDFVPGMSELEGRSKDFKRAIDEKLISGADRIAEQFFGGELAIGEQHEQYIRKAIGDEFRANAKRGPKTAKLFGEVSDIVSKETAKNRGFVISERVGGVLESAAKSIKKFNAVDRILSAASHFKTEHSSETLVANNWNKVTNTVIKHLGYSEEEIMRASKSKAESKKLFMQKMEALCADSGRYKEFLTDVSAKMAELDEKMDSPNLKSNSGIDRVFGGSAGKTSGRTMEKIRDGFIQNCDETGSVFDRLGLTSMKRKMSGIRTNMGTYSGSIKESRLERLGSRVDSVHSSYMRLLNTAEFFRRAHLYEQEVKAVGAENVAALGEKVGATSNHEWNLSLFQKGKEVLSSAKSSDFYGKMGLQNDKTSFLTLMWQAFRPDQGGGANDKWCEATDETVRILDDVKVKDGDTMKAPRRALEGVERIPLGQKLKQHMNYFYDNIGSIARNVQGDRDPLRVETRVSKSAERACKRFDLVGCNPADMIHDALKQKYNSGKWMKMFAPALAVLAGVTVVSQFFFGKKDNDIKA